MHNCYNKIEINAPVIQVWERIRDFHDLSWVSDVITSVEMIGERAGDGVGARRVLNDSFHENLLEV